jgi:hypothetical protein
LITMVICRSFVCNKNIDDLMAVLDDRKNTGGCLRL